jgi:hypothetical protein
MRCNMYVLALLGDACSQHAWHHGTQVSEHLAEFTGGHLPLWSLPLSRISEDPGFTVQLYLLLVLAAQ